MTKEIKFRADLDKKTRELMNSIESGEAFIRQLDKKISDLLYASSSGSILPDLSALNDQRSEAWKNLRDSKKAWEELTAAKKKILADVGLDWKEIRIGLHELPTTESEFCIRLHGLREPARGELLSAMMSTGLLRAYHYVAPPHWGDQPNLVGKGAR